MKRQRDRAPGGVPLAWMLAVAFLVGATPALADGSDGARSAPLTIDDLGFSNAMDEQVFTRSYRLSSISALPVASPGLSLDSAGAPGLSARSELQIEVDESDGIGSGLSLTEGLSSGQGEVSIRRFSTALSGSEGTLTVGSDWSNFQDFLPVGTTLTRQGLVAEQISWASEADLGRFSVALERDYELLGDNRIDRGLSDQSSSAPSLILSWRGATDDQRGLYGVTALGRDLELDDVDTSSDTGWGLNLAGGWRFGELFAALSVTLGDSIDSFILGRMGDRSTASAASRYLNPGESIHINPSLNYRLGDSANLHLSVNRFATDTEDTPHGVETLDTIHLGYTWTPWPSTRIGIEFVGKDVEGPGAMEDSNEVNFAASKRF